MKTISIIVPAHNEEKSISPCISSLLNLDYPKHLYKIIVVLGECTDSTYDVLKKFKSKVKIIKLKENHGPAEARNIGCKHSKSEIICFIDGDCRADKEWLKEIVKCFQSLEVAVVGGKTIPDFEPNTLFKKYIYNQTTDRLIKKRIEYGIGWGQLASEHPKNMKKIRLILNCFFNLTYKPFFWVFYFFKKKDYSTVFFPFFSIFEGTLNSIGVLIGLIKFGFK